ncbi:hypothetical protein PCAR4_330047 [Paraburkholderia caribensis]|nr:hypothetical protein PCAR4_330047 [Paraburkholderia caribensis]
MTQRCEQSPCAHQNGAKTVHRLSDFSMNLEKYARNQRFDCEINMHHSKTECTSFVQFTGKVAPEVYNPG